VATVDAHITGTVWTIDVDVGDVVDEGDVVAVLESMKMEMPVEAEVSGIVAEVLCASGQPVEEGQPLVRLHGVSDNQTVA
jgi:acetyl-CoA carboxylase biotin carboxyl carrier protein